MTLLWNFSLINVIIHNCPPPLYLPHLPACSFCHSMTFYCDCCCAAAQSLQSCPTLRLHRRQPTRLLCPWDSPDKNTGVGCHFLLLLWALSTLILLKSNVLYSHYRVSYRQKRLYKVARCIGP